MEKFAKKRQKEKGVLIVAVCVYCDVTYDQNHLTDFCSEECAELQADFMLPTQPESKISFSSQRRKKLLKGTKFNECSETSVIRRCS